MRVTYVIIFMISFLAGQMLQTRAEHHMRRYPAVLGQQSGGSRNIPLQIVNQCPQTIHPAIDTRGGTGPQNTGFQLSNRDNQTVHVSHDWQGRVWGRTNCSFTSSGEATTPGGQACQTGDCGGELACKIPGVPPATLAEFTMNGSHSRTYYDISLVDGYNLPMAIVLLPNDVPALGSIDQSTTNPSCIASVGDLAPQTFNPYNGDQQFLGTSGNGPLPFDVKQTASSVSSWCPWDLQVSPPEAPGHGVYPYPDNHVVRRPFNPCLSACAKYGQSNYCCMGKHDTAKSCRPNYYSKSAKAVCPDAYSYAYDDQTSTFSAPTGGGYQIIFCPGGRSTNVITVKGTTGIPYGANGSSNGSDTLKSVARRLKLERTLQLVTFTVILVVMAAF